MRFIPHFTALSLSIAACGYAPTAAAAPTCAYKPGEFKPYVSGNVARKWEQVTGKNEKYLDHVSAMVIEMKWKDLEPSEGKYNFGKLGDEEDDSLEDKLQLAYENGKTVRLRVFAGTYAPDFAKTVNGFRPIQWINNDGQNNIQTLGPFWTPAYQRKWQNFQRALAARYNCDPRLNEVQIAGTGTITPEVMLLQTRTLIRGADTPKNPSDDFSNGDSLRAGRFSDSERNARLEEDVAFMQDTWTHTHLTLWLHTYGTLEKGFPQGWSESLRLARKFHDRSPGHIAFGHTGAGEALLKGEDDRAVLSAYRQLRDWRVPMTVQTQAVKPSGHTGNPGVGDIEYVIDRLSDRYNRDGFRALGVELPTTWQTQLGDAKALMQEYNRLMAVNAGYLETLHHESD